MQHASGGRERNFDFMRAVAIVCVLIIHSAYGYERTPGQELIANWLGTFTRPCIAIFLFVSGYFFRVNADARYLTQRLERVLLPYLVFSGLALLYQTKIIHLPQHLRERPLSILGDLLIGNTWGVYWFIPMIIATYLVGWRFARGRPSAIVWATITFFAINLIHVVYYQPLIDRYDLADHPAVWLYSYRLYISWPFYFFLGVLFREYRLRQFVRQHRRNALLLWAFVFATYNALFFLGIVQTGSYTSLIDTLAAVTAIAALCALDIDHPLLNFVGESSYTIYLVHYFFIALANRLAPLLLADPPFWFSGVVFLAALGGSLAFCWAARRLLGARARLWLGV